MTTSRLVGVAVTLALLVGASGCSDGAGSGNPPTAPSSPSPTLPEPRALTEGERATIDRAEGLLTQRCMARHGYDIFLTEVPEVPEDRPFGNDDLRIARSRGLDLGAPVTPTSRHDSPNGRYFTGLSERQQAGYLAALNGDPRRQVSVRTAGGLTLAASTQGCTAAAQRRLYGSFEDWFRAQARVEALPGRYLQRVGDHPVFQRRLAAWVRCMRQRGHPVQSPQDLRARAASAGRHEQRAAAVDEAHCSRSTRLTSTGESLLRRFRAQAYAGHRALVLDYQRLSVLALQRAQAITPELTPGTGPG